MTRHLLTLLASLFLVSCGHGISAGKGPAQYSYQVLNTYPHDPFAFTQGLEYHDGLLFESTGLNGRSSVRKVDLQTGKVLQQSALPDVYFGEGITVVNNLVIELTWQGGKGFVYDAPRLQLIRSFDYPGEGWGLTHDANRIFMSDGTQEIRLWNPLDLHEMSRIQVKDGDQPVRFLNELEWVKGEIWANVWQTDRIARISPNDGRVTGWIDLNGLLPPAERNPEGVLNGIAYDEQHDRIFVTGKLWPKLYEIKIVAKRD